MSAGPLGAALIALPIWTPVLARWLQNPYGLSLRSDLAGWLAGRLVFVVVLIAAGAFGRTMRGNPGTIEHGRLDRAGGTLQRQEWHLVDPVEATHLVLTWRKRE